MKALMSETTTDTHEDVLQSFWSTSNFVKCKTVEVQSNTEVYSSFATIYINPVITVI